MWLDVDMMFVLNGNDDCRIVVERLMFFFLFCCIGWEIIVNYTSPSIVQMESNGVTLRSVVVSNVVTLGSAGTSDDVTLGGEFVMVLGFLEFLYLDLGWWLNVIDVITNL